jgi:hypothetical protein
MAIYSLGLKSTNTTINNALVEIYTPSTLAIKIMEIGIGQTVATACEYGLGRPANQGITPVPVAFQAEQSTTDPAAKTNASLSWGTSPTAPSIYMRRLATAASIGSGVIWTFPRGYVLPASASIVIFNITASVACDLWIVIDE